MALHTQKQWGNAGLAWRSNFFIRGQLYRRKDQQQLFRALSGSSNCKAFWPCREISAHVWAEDETASPEWFSLFSWDDWEAIPSQPLSPLGAFARGFGFSVRLGHLLIANPRPPLKHAALLGFRGCSASDLRTLAQELGLCVKG